MILEQAIRYREQWGWSLIPIRLNEKRPAVRWKRFQSERADEPKLRQWFRENEHGIGVVFGEPSNNLGSRDFDDDDSYREWAEQHPRLAADYPTVRTRRGFHLYFETNPNDVASIRERLGKPNGVGAIPCGDGELRVGRGCYSVLPPTSPYRWVVPLDRLKRLDNLTAAGLTPETTTRLAADADELSEAEVSASGTIPHTAPPIPLCNILFAWTALPVDEAIALAIRETLPTGPGQRHYRLFYLARCLKAIPALRNASVSELRPIVKEWHRRALPRITTKAFSESWSRFCNAWAEAQCPARPSLAVIAQEADGEGIERLRNMCRLLQRLNGDRPFFLTCRGVAGAVGRSPMTAHRWLQKLLAEGSLRLVRRGHTGHGSEYRFVEESARCH